eukprot:TRINITY_DN11036_c0_g1_i3.p1 TRINITY_DN11036_c0_g1~~TRINITY_DN11036_c0_g1_i3.p1  ORF type:complete len:263 (+),score=36.13 TRINITY_DN11036_c0_g1_i3:79-789(+)
MLKRAFVSKNSQSAGSDRRTRRTEDSPQEPDASPRSLFNDFLDVLRTVLLQFERQSALEWLEALISEEPSAYVDGFGKVAWMSAKLRTVVDGRRLPKESVLVYAGVRLSNRFDAEDEEECFLLGAFLSVIHALLQLDQLELVVQLLENMSEEVLAAALVGMDDAQLSKLRRRIASRPAQELGPPVLASGSRRRRAELGDGGDQRLDEVLMISAAGLDPMPLSRISERRRLDDPLFE